MYFFGIRYNKLEIEHIENTHLRPLNDELLNVMVIILSVIASIFASVFVVFFLWLSLFFVNKKSHQKIMLRGYIVALSIVVSLISSSKIPESDLINYIDHFHAASDLSFLEFSVYFKEPGYAVIVYVFDFLSQSNVAVFLLLFAFLSYYLFLTSLRILGEKIEIHHSLLVSIISMAAFFPLIFSGNLHLMRQTLAVIVFILAFVLTYNKRRMIYILSAPLFHITSLAIVIIYSAYSFFGFRANLIILAAGVAMFYFFSQILALVIGTFSMLALDLSQYYASKLTTQNFGILNPLGVAPKLFVISAMIISCAFLVRVVREKIVTSDNLVSMVWAFFCICALVLLFSQFDELSEIVNRYLYYLYYLFFIVLLLFAKEFDSWYLRYLLNLGVIFSFVLFAFNVSNGTWVYQNFECRILSLPSCLI